MLHQQPGHQWFNHNA